MNAITRKETLILSAVLGLFLIGGNAEAVEISTESTEVTAENRINSITGSSCKNFMLGSTPTQEKAMAELVANAKKTNAKRISLPQCKATMHAGVSTSCGTYWSQVVCQAVVVE